MLCQLVIVNIMMPWDIVWTLLVLVLFIYCCLWPPHRRQQWDTLAAVVAPGSTYQGLDESLVLQLMLQANAPLVAFKKVMGSAEDAWRPEALLQHTGNW